MKDLNSVLIKVWSLLSIGNECLCLLLEEFSLNWCKNAGISILDPELAIIEVIKANIINIKEDVFSLSFPSNYNKIYDKTHQLKPRIKINKLDMTFICDFLSSVSGFYTCKAKYRRSFSCNNPNHPAMKTCCSTCNHTCKICNLPKCKKKRCCMLQTGNCNHACQNSICGNRYTECYRRSTVCCLLCKLCPNCAKKGNCGMCKHLKLREAIEILKKLRNSAAHETSKEIWEELLVGANPLPDFPCMKNWDDLWTLTSCAAQTCIQFLYDCGKLDQNMADKKNDSLKLIQRQSKDYLIYYFQKGIENQLCCVAEQKRNIFRDSVIKGFRNLEKSLHELNSNSDVSEANKKLEKLLEMNNEIIKHYKDLDLQTQSTTSDQHTEVIGKLTMLGEHLNTLQHPGMLQQINDAKLLMLECKAILSSHLDLRLAKNERHLNEILALVEEIKTKTVINSKSLKISLKLKQRETSDSLIINDVDNNDIDSNSCLHCCC